MMLRTGVASRVQSLYIYIYIQMQTCIYIYICTNTYLFAYLCLHVHIYIYICRQMGNESHVMTLESIHIV